MRLPKVSAEQQKKREAAALAASGPTPESEAKLGDQALNPAVTSTTTPPAPSPAKGDKETPDGKMSSEPVSALVPKETIGAFGVDLSDVSVHMGEGADKQCADRGALAFAAGSIIVISSGAGSPGSAEFLEIIGHELAHVVQQRGGNTDAGSGGNAEAEADSAGAAAAAGEAASVGQSAPAGGEQNKEGETEYASTTTVKIPIPGGASIEFEAPSQTGNWSIGVGDLPPFNKDGFIEHKDSKWWRKSIPTPFWGLVAEVGAQVGMEFKLGEVALKGVKVAYNARDDLYAIEAEVGTGLSLEVFFALTAGVAADVWVASAGVGLKAKASVSKSHPVSAKLFAGYSSASGFQGGVELNLAALELAAKASVALYAYYDALGVSTYCKDWTLAERTLGKFTAGGVKAALTWKQGEGFDGTIEPKPVEMQDFEGKISDLYPSKG